MKKSAITPNYERMRASYCYYLQTAWVNYCKASNAYLTSIWFDDNGKLCMLYSDKLKEKMDEAEAAFNKAGKDLHDFDVWVAMEKKMKGE